MNLKKGLDVVVGDIIDEYNNAMSSDEKTKALNHLLKTSDVVLKIKNDEIENRIKRSKIKIEQEKIELEQAKLELDKEKLELDITKSKLSQENDSNKIELDKNKFDLDIEKFNFEKKKSKKEKIFNIIIKGLEVGLPLLVYGTLSVLALKATYKDDVRVPSETWNFIKGVSRK